MRLVICCISLLTTTLLVGCGQTGALQLPSDPNYDKRAQYLLYKNAETKAKAEQVVEKKAEARVAQQTDSNSAKIQ